MKPITKAAILMAIIVVVFVAGWEIHLRAKGIIPSYDEGKEQWADKRAKVYDSRVTVCIGASRIKYDLDIDTWRRFTARQAVQLAMEGNSPLPILEDLAADLRFAGKLIIDITETTIFNADNGPGRHEQIENINYYKDRTPSQRASFVLNYALESQFVFLDKGGFSLNAMLDELPIRNRPGVVTPPLFPQEFHWITFDRQDKMSPHFLEDTTLQRQVKNIWLNGQRGRDLWKVQHPEDPSPAIITRMVAAVAKIRSRGGEIVFVRPPSSEPLRTREEKLFPRARYWEQLLVATQCKGFHYADDPETANLVCPEWSHLSPEGAIVYTRSLIRQLPESFTQ